MPVLPLPDHQLPFAPNFQGPTNSQVESSRERLSRDYFYINTFPKTWLNPEAAPLHVFVHSLQFWLLCGMQCNNHLVAG